MQQKIHLKRSKISILIVSTFAQFNVKKIHLAIFPKMQSKSTKIRHSGKIKNYQLKMKTKQNISRHHKNCLISLDFDYNLIFYGWNLTGQWKLSKTWHPQHLNEMLTKFIIHMEMVWLFINCCYLALKKTWLVKFSVCGGRPTNKNQIRIKTEQEYKS